MITKEKLEKYSEINNEINIIKSDIDLIDKTVSDILENKLEVRLLIVTTLRVEHEKPQNLLPHLWVNLPDGNFKYVPDIEENKETFIELEEYNTIQLLENLVEWKKKDIELLYKEANHISIEKKSRRKK